MFYRSERLPQLPTVSKPAESSSETDDADREVAEMTQNVEGADSRGRRDGAAVDREKNKWDLALCQLFFVGVTGENFHFFQTSLLIFPEIKGQKG